MHFDAVVLKGLKGLNCLNTDKCCLQL